MQSCSSLGRGACSQCCTRGAGGKEEARPGREAHNAGYSRITDCSRQLHGCSTRCFWPLMLCKQSHGPVSSIRGFGKGTAATQYSGYLALQLCLSTTWATIPRQLKLEPLAACCTKRSEQTHQGTRNCKRQRPHKHTTARLVPGMQSPSPTARMTLPGTASHGHVQCTAVMALRNILRTCAHADQQRISGVRKQVAA
jgi:hypothetical protein